MERRKPQIIAITVSHQYGLATEQCNYLSTAASPGALIHLIKSKLTFAVDTNWRTWLSHLEDKQSSHPAGQFQWIKPCGATAVRVSKCCTLCDSLEPLAHRSGNDYWSRGHFLSSLHHSDAFPSFVFVLQRGVCVRERFMKSGECWNKEETPWVNPEVPSDNWLVSLTHTLTMTESSIEGHFCAASLLGDPEEGSSLSAGATPRCEGAGNAGCPAWSTGRGRQSRGTRPRWMSGQHLFGLLAGSYQQKRCHTRWTGEDREKRAFFAEFKKTCRLLFVL